MIGLVPNLKLAAYDKFKRGSLFDRWNFSQTTPFLFLKRIKDFSRLKPFTPILHL